MISVWLFFRLLELLGLLQYLPGPAGPQIFCELGTHLVTHAGHAYCLPDAVWRHLRH